MFLKTSLALEILAPSSMKHSSILIVHDGNDSSATSGWNDGHW